MQITHNNKPYTLDIEQSIKLGVLKPVLPPTKTIELTQDEAAGVSVPDIKLAVTVQLAVIAPVV